MRNINNNQFPAEQLAGVAGMTITHMLIVAVVLVLGGLVFSAIRRTYDLRLRLRERNDDLTTSWVRVWCRMGVCMGAQLTGWAVWLSTMDDDRAYNKRTRRTTIKEELDRGVEMVEEARQFSEPNQCAVDQELIDASGMRFTLDANWWKRDKSETVITKDEDTVTPTVTGRIPTPPHMQEIPRTPTTEQVNPVHSDTADQYDKPNPLIRSYWAAQFDNAAKSKGGSVIKKFTTRTGCVVEMFHETSPLVPSPKLYGVVGRGTDHFMNGIWDANSGYAIWVEFSSGHPLADQELQQFRLVRSVPEGDMV